MLRQSKFSALALGVLMTTCLLWAGDPPSASSGDDAGAEALRQLQIGHARFLCDKPDHPRADANQRESTFKGGQHPFAMFLSCADSRVPVEVIFDQGVGDLFVVRVAGNVSDKHQAGSIEYAVEHLHAPLLVVMGHRGCGAVAAAVSNGHIEGNVASIVDSIKPAVERAERANPGLKGDGLMGEAVKANVFLSVETLLKSSPMLAQMVKSRKLTIVGAVYDIETATVNWLGRHPQESQLCSGEALAQSEPPTKGKDADHKQPTPQGKTAVAGASATGGGGHGSGTTGGAKPTEPVKPKQPASGGGGGHP